MGNSGDKLAAVEKISMSVHIAPLFGDTLNAKGVYHFNCFEVMPEHKAEYDAVLSSQSQYARGSKEYRDLQDELDSFPMFKVWQDNIPAHNIVCTLGRNLILDTALSGSAYTANVFMGLISSVSLVNLSTTISSGTYTTGTGAVSLTTAAAHGLTVGDSVTIASAAGTGSFAAINGTFTATTGTTGSTLNFTVSATLTMTITGGNVTTTSPTRIADTMAGHTNWTEAGSTNAPTFAARVAPAFSAAANSSKSTSTAVSFTMTGAGTLAGAFIAFGTGAVSTLMSTTGTLLSAGAFTGGNQVVSNGNVVTVSYTLSQ